MRKIYLTIAILLSIVVSSYSQSMPCAGLAVSGDYSYEVYTASGKVYFKLQPLGSIVGSSGAIVYIKEGAGGGAYPGYTMVSAGGNFTYNKTIANGTNVSFYFSYAVPAGGEQNSSANPHGYVAGTTCAAGAPNVTLTSPIEAASFVAPANLTLKATALDIDGTVAKVEFYRGTTLLGEDASSPYTFDWVGAAAGSYALTAKAIDNIGNATSSIPVNIVVSAPNQNGYCGTAFNGQYEHRTTTLGSNVQFVMHPLPPVVGSEYAFIYIKEGAAPEYSGTAMTRSGNDFVFTKPIANNVAISYYFTYNLPAGGENNSSANPHTYTVGTNCVGSGTPPVASLSVPGTTFTEPATIALSATASDADGTVSKVVFYNSAATIGTDLMSPYAATWSNVPAGNYTVTAKATDNSAFIGISPVVNVVVNINFSTGFCGTLANGDYSYKIETVGGNAVFSFRPLAPINGCAYALVYILETGAGPYPGYQMTKIGSDFRFSKPIANNTNISVYFTYMVPAGGERTSLLTPHSYVVGTNCLTSATSESAATSKATFRLYPNPTENQLFIRLADAAQDMKGSLKIINIMGQLVYNASEIPADGTIDVRILERGIYYLQLQDEKTQQVYTQSFVKCVEEY